MSSVRFLTFSDIHLSSVNPESRIGSYEKDIFHKLTQIKKIGIALNVQFFTFAGDLFHLKAPMRNPHALNSKIIELFSSFPGPIFATEGNHDLRADSYDTFDEQPLNVIYKSGALKQVRDAVHKFGDMNVRIRSFPFTEAPDLGIYPRADKNCIDFSICILHLYTHPDGGNLFANKLYSYEEIAQLGDDIFVLGHYHIDQGIVKAHNKIFVNVGAISRGSSHEENLNRIPKIGYISVENTSNGYSYDYKTIALKVKPASEVFNLNQKEENKKRNKDIEEFISRLRTDTVVVPDAEDKIEAEVSGMNLDKEIYNKVMYFLEEAHLKRKTVEE